MRTLMQMGLLVTGLVVGAPAAHAQVTATDTASVVLSPERLRLAGEMLGLIGMDQQFTDIMNASIDVAMRAITPEQQAQMPFLRDVMVEFFGTYFTWDAIRPELARIYARTFTEPELRDMIVFYKTPTGRKLAAQTSNLLQEGAQIGRKVVQDHMPELQTMIMRRLKAQQDAEPDPAD